MIANQETFHLLALARDSAASDSSSFSAFELGYGRQRTGPAGPHQPPRPWTAKAKRGLIPQYEKVPDAVA